MFAPAAQSNPQSHYAAMNNHAGKAPHDAKAQKASDDSRSSVGFGDKTPHDLKHDKGLGGRVEHTGSGKSGLSSGSGSIPSSTVRDAKPSVVYIHTERFERVETYSSSRSHSIAPSGPITAAEPSEHAEVAAGNILNFIEARLQMDLAASATPEELASRLEAGLDGFLQGFEEARGQLDDLGLLSDEMAAEIQGTYDLVMAGIADFEERFLQGGTIDKPEPRMIKSTASAETVEHNRSEAAQSNRFSFELTTADGDTVVINASSVGALISESLSQSSGRVEFGHSLMQASYQSSEFSLSVEGELDEAEMAAINDLLGQVSELSTSFFDGDLDQAFASALNLGYDSSEIVQFSLNLSQSSVQRVTQAYQQFIPSAVSALGSPDEQQAPVALTERLKPLGSFVQGLIETLESASYFSAPGDLIEQLAEFFDRPEQPRFQLTVSQLLEGIESL